MRSYLPVVLLLMLSACGGQSKNADVDPEAVVWRADAAHLSDPRQFLKANFKGLSRKQAFFYDRQEKAVYLVGERIAGLAFTRLPQAELGGVNPYFRSVVNCLSGVDCAYEGGIGLCSVTFDLKPETSGDPLDQVTSVMMARGYPVMAQVSQAGGERPRITFKYYDADECAYLESDVRENLPRLIGARLADTEE